jgi:N-methylhydantoinase A
VSRYVGIDIGGTFTDFTVVGPEGTELVWKVDTTVGRWEEGVAEGLRAVAGKLGLELPEFLGQAELLVHGSTIATNTMIERNGPRIGLVCTRGFRDVLYFRDGYKWDRFNPRVERPREVIERSLRLAVDERILADGSISRPLDEGDVRRAAETFRAEGVEVVAVALLWAQVNGIHEQRVRAILGEELPGVPVLISSEILPETGEWKRTSATAISAYVYPRVSAYLQRLEGWLRANGLKTQLQVMQLNGGCTSVEHALKKPVTLIHSGPAAAPAAGLYVAARARSANGHGPEPARTPADLITIDMGGTSFEVSVVQDGHLSVSRKIFVDHQPLGVPGMELRSIGAGGGSVAWIDSGGALRVGPQSAGASPGPAAYDRGGTEPTVTDANLVLGYLPPQGILGGSRALNLELARAAIESRVAGPLRMSVDEAAAGVIEVVNENMIGAIHAVTTQRGIDPRGFVMVCGGGAGALHACRLAAGLQMSEVLVPAEASALSAYGMIVTDVRHDYSAALYTSTSDLVTAGEVQAVFDELERAGGAELDLAGFDQADRRFDRLVDARYQGQVNELMVPVPAGRLGPDFYAQVRADFERQHRERYTFALPDNPVEFLHWRVTAWGLHRRPAQGEIPGGGPRASATPRGTRRAYLPEENGFIEMPVYGASEVRAGEAVTGPALIDADTTTIMLIPGFSATGDGLGSFLISRKA